MAWMRPMLEGSGDVEPGLEAPSKCGTDPIPANYSAGALLIAQDPVALALQFLILTSTTEGGTAIDFDPNNIAYFSPQENVFRIGVKFLRFNATPSSQSITTQSAVVANILLSFLLSFPV
jgi:hypothetical protein